MSNVKFRSDLKIIVIGNAGTGKTSFVNKWTKNIFNEAYKATIVSEFGFKIFEDKGSLYRIQLWDLAGMDQNAMITKIFAKDSQGCVILCDATDKKTRNDTIKWKKSVDEEASFFDDGKIPCILIENKIDLLSDEEKLNDDPELNNFAQENEFINCFRTSAKDGININEAMSFLIKNIIEKMENVSQSGKNVFSTDRKSVVLNKENHTQSYNVKRKKDGSCC
jgi:small GTP-binding protein